MIQFIAQTGSTSADLAERLRAGDALLEGHWLIADRQTAGRGRSGRAWSDGNHAGGGNFMGSTVVRPGFGDPEAGTLALVTGLAVLEAIKACCPGAGLEAMLLKWPNDILIGRAKLAGMLMERQGDAVVIGIGVNLAQAPDLPDRETTALSAYGLAPERNYFAEVLARQFTLELDRWRSFGMDPIVNRWLAAAHPVGTPLQVEGVPGAFHGLTREGHLQLRLADGAVQTIHAGEVNLAD